VYNQNKKKVKHLVKECVTQANKEIKEQLKLRQSKEFQGLKEIVYGICDKKK